MRCRGQDRQCHRFDSQRMDLDALRKQMRKLINTRGADELLRDL